MGGQHLLDGLNRRFGQAEGWGVCGGEVVVMTPAAAG
jgi:hypothetical protein